MAKKFLLQNKKLLTKNNKILSVPFDVKDKVENNVLYMPNASAKDGVVYINKFKNNTLYL